MQAVAPAGDGKDLIASLRNFLRVIAIYSTDVPPVALSECDSWSVFDSGFLHEYVAVTEDRGVDGPTRMWLEFEDHDAVVNIIPVAAIDAWNRKLPDPITVENYGQVLSLRSAVHGLVGVVAGRQIWQADGYRGDLILPDPTWFRRRYIGLYGGDAITFVRDTCGLLAAGRQLTAYETSGRALQCALEMALGSYGDYHAHGWTATSRLASSPHLTEELADLLSLVHPEVDLGSREVLAKTAVLRLSAATRLAACASLFAWNAPLTGPLPLAPATPTGHGLVRSSRFLPVRVDDGVMLGGEGGVGLSVAAAVLWASADGRTTIPDLTARFARITDTAEDRISSWATKELARQRDSGLLYGGDDGPAWLGDFES